MSQDPPVTMSFDTSFGDANYINPLYSQNSETKMIFSSFQPEYKLSYPPSMESQIRKLKLSMEPIREVVLFVNSMLLWEKQWHPTAILSSTTLMFMLLWLFNPSILTVAAVLGLMLTIGDYFVPYLLGSLLKYETWDPEKQKRYEEICTNIILYKTKAELLISSYCRLRVTNPKLYFAVTIFGLCFLIWLGGAVDNLFLTYLVITIFLMLPGMHHHGMLNRFNESFSKLFNDLVENAKAKVTQKKVQ